jgi:phosphopantothenoylcysteine decarboxylase/phosphopantothenate--cysteine ligase
VKSNVLEGRRIAVCVGGGIAAYKACDLVRELLRKGAEVRVAMTEAAQRFVTPLTLQSLSGQRVLTDSFDVGPEETFGHLHLSRWAEAFVVAPATADLLARLRAGMANDAVTTTLLAFPGPVVLAPAMNTAMWDNPVTQANLAALLAQPRIRTVGPGVGLLADGDVGAGRLADLSLLVEAIRGVFTAGSLAGKRVLITAGPTREAIDPVRFISNPSTGKMGLAVAAEARRLGAEVTVVLGPVGEAAVSGISVVPVVTAEQMLAAVLERVDGADVFVASAAVSDWRPQIVSSVKVKKGDGPLALALERTPDVLLSASTRVHAKARRPVLVGFAAETHDVLTYAKGKLVAKRLDFVVANDVSAPGAGFGGETNLVTVLGADGSQTPLAGTKREVAARLWAFLLEKGLEKGGPS